MELTHLNEAGRAQMVDVGDKVDSRREAVAKGEVHMRAQTLALIQQGGVPKGDVLAVAQIAGIMAAKRTHELIPMCHTLMLDKVDITYAFRKCEKPDSHEPAGLVEITATVRCEGKTGVEMEALTAVSIAALTVYDMCKAVERTMRIENVRLVRKSGGRSGDIVNE